MNASRLWPLALCLLTLGLSPRATAQPGGSSNAKPLVVNSDGTIAGPVSAGTFKTANSIGTGGGGSSAWGDITGTLSNQTDLNTALGLRVLTSTLNGYFADPSTNGSFSASAWRTDLGLVIGTNVQAYSANLLTFAAIAPSANVQSLLSAADYSAMRTQLSLVPGTNVQAFDEDLAALAVLSGTNTLYYRSGANTWTAVTIGSGLSFTGGTLTAVGGGGGDLLASNNLSDLANASTALTNLGGTTVGKALFGLTNPSAVTFPRVNADNTVTARSASEVLTDLGLATVATSGSASDLSTGTLPDGRFPATLPAANGSALTALNASNLGSGTIPDARFPATLPAASGANLTAINGSNISSGTVADARIASTLTRNADFDTASERAALGFKTTTHGGLEALQDHGAMGATETFDLATANAHIGTLDADVTFTLTGFTSGKFCSTIIGLLQNGTGGWNVTWPAAVVDAPTVTSTADAITWVSLWSTDGGTTIYASSTADGGGGGSGDASTNTSSSVDSEVALFSGTGGKTLKRATGTGLAKLTSGVLSTASSGTDYEPARTTVSQADAEAGTSTTVYAWTPQRIAQAIAALESGGASVPTNGLILWPTASLGSLPSGFLEADGTEGTLDMTPIESGTWIQRTTGVVPTLSSATIGTNGTTFTMVFSEAVDFGAGGNGGFVPTLSGGAATLSYSSGSSSNTLVYTLSRTVIDTETGTLAYTQPGNGVEDGINLDLASFSGTSITNNSEETGGGSPAWAYTIASGSLDANDPISTTVFYWQQFTAQAGATTKISLYIRGFTYASNLKLALYDGASAGASRLQVGSVNVTSTGEAEVTITSTATTATTYAIGWIAENTGALDAGRANGVGTSYIDYTNSYTYAGGPPATLPTPSETRSLSFRVGTYTTP